MPAALLLLTPLSAASVVPSQAAAQPVATISASAHPVEKPAGVAPAATFAETLTEDFESVWPRSGWTLSDLSNNDGGEYLWGQRSCNPHSGNQVAWSVGGGADGSQLSCLSSDYPDNTLTLAEYGPFDLSNALSATVTYYIYGSTEWDGTNDCPFDRFTIVAYTDTEAFDGYYYCGNWTNGPDGNGYYKRILDLTNVVGPGQGNSWLRLEFESDDSVGDIGMLVDDITISVTYPTPTPTDTPTNTPIGAPTNTPTDTPTNTPTNTPTRTVGPGTVVPAPSSRRIYIPISIREPVPTPLQAPTAACPDDLEANNIPEDAKQLTTINRACVGSFQNEQVGSFDYYWIQPNVGQQVSVDLTGQSAGANYDIALIRQDGPRTYLKVDQSETLGQANEHFDYVIDSAKRYYVRVSLKSKSSSAKNTYVLAVNVK